MAELLVLVFFFLLKLIVLFLKCNQTSSEKGLLGDHTVKIYCANTTTQENEGM